MIQGINHELIEKVENTIDVAKNYDRIITRSGKKVPDFKQGAAAYDKTGKRIDGGNYNQEDANANVIMNEKRGMVQDDYKKLDKIETDKRMFRAETEKLKEADDGSFLPVYKLKNAKITGMEKLDFTPKNIKPGEMHDGGFFYYPATRDQGVMREVSTVETGFYHVKELEYYDFKYAKDISEIFNKGQLYCWLRFYGYVESYNYSFMFYQSSTYSKAFITHIQKIYFRNDQTEINKIKKVGCLVTCIADVVSYYKGEIIRPRDVNDVANQLGAYLIDKGGNETSDLDRDKVMKHYGFKVKGEPIKYIEGDSPGAEDSRTSFHETLQNRINADKPTIMHLHHTADASGHFVVVVGARYRGKIEGNIPASYIVNDPGNDNEKVRYIDTNTMISENKKRKVNKIYLYDYNG